MSKTFDLHWKQVNLKAKFKLFLLSRKENKKKIKSKKPQVKAGGYSTLSSTCYSIVSTAHAQFTRTIASNSKSLVCLYKVPFWFFTWGPLSAWCYLSMLYCTKQVVKVLGYKRMSADMCDIHQSILRAWKMYDEAIVAAQKGLEKNPKHAHTRGLLHLGCAKGYLGKMLYMEAREQVMEATKEARKAERQNPLQASRIYRGCAEVLDYIGDKHMPWTREILRAKATKLAKKKKAQDQLLKI